jgi:steroid delta-isomerase-like uncharacterized protein
MGALPEWHSPSRRRAREAVTQSMEARIAAAMLVVVAGCGAQLRDGETLRQHHKALVQRWIEEGFNQHNVAVVDGLFAERFAVNGQVVGRDGVKASMTRHLRGFPDLHVVIDDIIVEGGRVAIWYTVEGTHQGEFEGIAATGKRVRWSGSDLVSIRDGKISEARFLSDVLGILKQLGATVEMRGSATSPARP